eukprot:433384_1
MSVLTLLNEVISSFDKLDEIMWIQQPQRITFLSSQTSGLWKDLLFVYNLKDDDDKRFYFNCNDEDRPYFLESLYLWTLNIDINNKIIDLDFDKISNNLKELI